MLFVARSEASATLLSGEAWAAPRLAASTASSVSPAISDRVERGGSVFTCLEISGLERSHPRAANKQASSVAWSSQQLERPRDLRHARLAGLRSRCESCPFKQRVEVEVLHGIVYRLSRYES